MDMNIKAKADESPQIQKAREKLEKKMAKEDKQINAKALDKMKQANQIWLKRHKNERIDLKDRGLELFDENRHPAGTKSRFVTNLMGQLKKESDKTKSYRPLLGRIEKQSG